MKNTLIASFIITYIASIYIIRRLDQIMFMNSAMVMLILLIEDEKVRKKTLAFLLIPMIIVLILAIIGFYNHGWDFDMTYKNIF